MPINLTESDRYQLVLVENETKKEIVLTEYGSYLAVSGGPSSFAGLSDTPANYTGANGQVLAVNAGEDGIEFIPAPGGAVDSVDGRTGVVALDDLYAPIVHTHVKADITDFSDGDYATSAQGALADSATQPGDLVSSLTNDAGYLTSIDLSTETVGELSDVDITGVADGSILKWNAVNSRFEVAADEGLVDSVFGRTGAVTAQAGDYGAFYATTAQGALADSATQPGDAISIFVNDAGYLTTAPVTSVAGKTGVVTLVKADITDFSDGDYATSAQGTLADTATQPGDDVSTLTNDSNYVASGANVSVFTNDAGYLTAITGESIGDLGDIDLTGLAANKILEYNGSNFVLIDTPTGGGGSSPLTTKGDLYTYDTGDARLPVGTDGQYLTADSAEPTGLKWVTSSGGGGATQLEELTDVSFSADTRPTGRYVRVHITDTNLAADNFVNIQEIAAYENAGKTDPITISSATASSEYSAGFTAAEAIDGNTSTYWGADDSGVPEWLYIDFGSTQTIAEVAITTGGGDGVTFTPRDFTIEVSDDATNWTTYSTNTGVTWTASEEKVYTLGTLIAGSPVLGDVFFYNGTNWSRLPVGTNGDKLTANSVVTNGLEWVADKNWLTANTGANFSTAPTASGVGGISLGSGAQSTSTDAVAIGANAQSTGNSAVAIGTSTQSTGTRAVAIGDNAQSTAIRAVAIGDGTQSTGIDTLMIGFEAGTDPSYDPGTRVHNYCVGIGARSRPNRPYTTAVGGFNDVFGEGGTAIGYYSVVDDASYGAVAIGRASQVSATGAIAIGGNTQTGESDPVLGSGSSATGTNSIAIGSGVSVTAANAVKVGNAANTLELDGAGALSIAGTGVNKQIVVPNYTTAGRPTPSGVGAHVFDTTLGKPIWHDGTNWVDATGATV